MRETRHYLGLELAGAKNHKTALAALEYYPKENKVFLLEVFDRIAVPEGEEADLGPAGPFGLTSSGDAALLELIQELTGDASPKSVRMAVNVPLQLPPVLSLSPARKGAKPAASVAAAVKWMREATRKAERAAKSDEFAPRVLEFTPYTQRPVELWVRYNVMSKLPLSHRFEIDETLGGTKAPLAARMNFLQRHIANLGSGIALVEAWPKLTVALLSLELDLPRRTIQAYRRLEEGVHAREQILETISNRHGIFIYERDVRKLSQSLAAFDAFICAYTALLSDTGRCAKPPGGFPAASGWVQYPRC